jgi:hypothetical protein
MSAPSGGVGGVGSSVSGSGASAGRTNTSTANEIAQQRRLRQGRLAGILQARRDQYRSMIQQTNTALGGTA